MRAVTIVVPLYAGVDSVVACLESLIEHVDLDRHTVLLCNDSGSEADAIERAVLDLAAGIPGVRYVRNEANLGFVENCNRAVLTHDQTDNDVLLLNSDTVVTAGFLDELLAVLHFDTTHGAVCPRSNNATIASLPFAARGPRTRERTAEVHAAVRDLLPRFSVAPVAMGFCLLIRRELIERFGLFDPVFSPGYGEENDFCLRIRAHGFRSLIAHRALVFHDGGGSFAPRRRLRLRAEHEALLVQRYPEYPALVRRYLAVERDAVDAVADCFAPSTPARILVVAEPDAQATPQLRAAALDPALAVTIVGDRSAVRRLRRELRGARFTTRAPVGLWDLAVAADTSSVARLSARVSEGGDLAALVAQPIDVDQLRARWIAAEPPTESAPLRGRAALAWVDRTLPFVGALARRALRRSS